MAMTRTATARREASVRLFFAIWPDPAACDAIVALAREIAAERQGKTPPRSNVHLTLAFVGDVALDRADTLAPIGAAAAQAAAPFRLSLDRVGGFRDAGIAWLGAADVPAPLATLVSQLREGLGAARFPVERRPFVAHVTLARKCATHAGRARRVAPVSWEVDTLALVASQLRARGARYQTLVEWPLGPSR
jgi:2'-5' RNA ligase